MDSFVVSARKYRPATFDLVVGQRSITATLKNAIRNKQLAQAFLFTGPRGVGKTTCARILAKTINCENISENIEACNVCDSCESFNRSYSFNVHELDAASNNSVDDIRTLVDQVRIPPQLGKYKVYIIDEVHMLSQQAFNAFLKTLEEPPPYAKFILATTEKHKIIPTILSRCQIFDFARITVNDIIGQLQYVARQEGVEAEQEALHIIAQKADGAMRDALSIYDQLLSFSGDSITYKQVIESLNVLDYEYFFRVLDLILEGDAAGMLLLIDEVIQKGFEGSDFITGFGNHLRSLLVGKDASTVKLIEASDEVKGRYLDQSVRCDDAFLLEALDLSSRADVQYKTSSNKRLTLELCLLQMIFLLKKKDRPEPAVRQPAPAAGAKVPKQPLPETTDPSQEEKKETTGATGSATRREEEHPAAGANVKKPAPTETTGPSQEEKKETTGATGSATKREENPPEAGPGHVKDSLVLAGEETVQPLQAHARPAKPAKPAAENITSRLSLKIHSKPPDEADDDTDDEPEAGELPADDISADQFSRVWKSMAEKYQQESQGLYLAMTRYEPLLEKEGLIVVFLDNAVQEDIFSEKKMELLGLLRRELNNYGLQMETRIRENGFKQKAYLPREKFEKMLEKNPDIAKLKKELDLDFDY